MSDYFTTDELAEFLRIKPRKVYDLISNFTGCLVGYLIVKITLEKH